MKHFFYCILVLVMAVLPVRAGLPVFLTKKEFASADLARAVNHFIGLGEDAAVAEMIRLDESPTDDSGSEMDRRVRLAMICRVIFDPRKDQVIRPARLGALFLPNLPPEDWPREPVVEESGVFFVLSEGYVLAGLPETIRRYLYECRTHGHFRNKPVKIPSRMEAQQALAGLVASPAWKRLDWSGKYNIEPAGSAIDFMRKQADAIPD